MKDMTQGNPTRLIISFAIPMLIGNIFQQIYNVADTIIVGRFLGASALAGVGSTGTLTCFLAALVIGLCNGAGLVAAQCFGCRNTEKLKQVIDLDCGKLDYCCLSAWYILFQIFSKITECS